MPRLTEEQIERVVEKRTDTVDQDYVRGNTTAETYRAELKAIDQWAENARK